MRSVVPSLRAPADLADAISSEEYRRLLGYPSGRDLDGPVLALADASRGWYRLHGSPWAFGREVEILSVDGSEIEVAGGVRLDSEVLARRLHRAEATALVVAAVSAGPEVDDRTSALWSEDRPDEAFFLDRFGAAVAEHLAHASGEALRSGGVSGVALPGYSPGYQGWPLEQQHLVYRLLTADPERPLPGPLRLLDSGMLTPKNSLLAVFGMTPDAAMAAQAWARHKCSWCALAGCDFRTVPR